MASVGKESACGAGDPGLIPELGISPGEGNGNPLQYSCLEDSHEQRSLVGYSLWGRKELDTTEATWHAHKVLYVCLCSMPHYMVESGNQARASPGVRLVEG